MIHSSLRWPRRGYFYTQPQEAARFKFWTDLSSPISAPIRWKPFPHGRGFFLVRKKRKCLNCWCWKCPVEESWSRASSDCHAIRWTLSVFNCSRKSSGFLIKTIERFTVNFCNERIVSLMKAVDKAVASDTRDPQIKSRHRKQFFEFNCVNCL